MATLQQQIAEKFIARLAEREDFDAEKVEQLRTLLAEGKKPKADELVHIFSLPAGGDLA
jgi:hypothetical protein